MGKGPTWSNLTKASGTIFVLRHGEKTEAGNHLDKTGWMRAEYLRSLWGDHGRFSSPKAVFANFYGFHESCHLDWSLCIWNSYELVQPLAMSLNLTVNHSFNRADNFKAAGGILSTLSMQNSPILVAWEHKHIVRLLVDMGCSRPWLEKWWSTNWPGTDFDEVFVLSFSNGTCTDIRLTHENFAGGIYQEMSRQSRTFLLICLLVMGLATILGFPAYLLTQGAAEDEASRQKAREALQAAALAEQRYRPLLGA